VDITKQLLGFTMPRRKASPQHTASFTIYRG